MLVCARLVAATFAISTALTAVAAAADPGMRYGLEPGRVFGYSALMEVQQGDHTEYHVGFPLVAVSGLSKNDATVVLAFRLEKVPSPKSIPSQPAEFHTEKISLQGGKYSMNEERRSFRHLPGSYIDHVFPRLPDTREQHQWGDREPFFVLGSSDQGHQGHQESRFEMLDSDLRFRETFERRIENKHGTLTEEWRGTGEVKFDPYRGIVASREFSLVHSKPPGDPRSAVHVKLTLRLLDEAGFQQAARATAVRLPGDPFSADEKSQVRTVTGSGRWAHADTRFYDTQKLLAAHEGGIYRAQVVGEAQDGLIYYRLADSRAFWDGQLPAHKFQFIPGEIHPSGDNVAVIDGAVRARLLEDLQGGDLKKAEKAIKQLANLRSPEPDDEIAEALVTWLGTTDDPLVSPFSSAMRHWATLKIAPDLARAVALPDGVTRRIGEAGLTGIGAPAESEIARRLERASPAGCARLLAVLGRIGTPQSLPLLEALKAQQADPTVTAAAKFAAVEIRQRHGLKSPEVLEAEARHREFERKHKEVRAEMERKHAEAEARHKRSMEESRHTSEEMRRKGEEMRRKGEQQRKQRQIDAARRRAGR